MHQLLTRTRIELYEFYVKHWGSRGWAKGALSSPPPKTPVHYWKNGCENSEILKQKTLIPAWVALIY